MKSMQSYIVRGGGEVLNTVGGWNGWLIKITNVSQYPTLCRGNAGTYNTGSYIDGVFSM